MARTIQVNRYIQWSRPMSGQPLDHHRLDFGIEHSGVADEVTAAAGAVGPAGHAHSVEGIGPCGPANE